MTREGLQLACKIIRAIDDKTARIGYNSPGALASVNHLHLHLLFVDKNLYVEDVVSWQQFKRVLIKSVKLA
jgi:GDP-D-glucose phosphorylase